MKLIEPPLCIATTLATGQLVDCFVITSLAVGEYPASFPSSPPSPSAIDTDSSSSAYEPDDQSSRSSQGSMNSFQTRGSRRSTSHSTTRTPPRKKKSTRKDPAGPVNVFPSPCASPSSSQRVVINKSRASLNTSLELTTLCGRSAAHDDSTHSGDSFVLNIDWDDEAFFTSHPSSAPEAVDDSFEDPYLLSRARMMSSSTRRSSHPLHHHLPEFSSQESPAPSPPRVSLPQSQPTKEQPLPQRSSAAIEKETPHPTKRRPFFLNRRLSLVDREGGIATPVYESDPLDTDRTPSTAAESHPSDPLNRPGSRMAAPPLESAPVIRTEFRSNAPPVPPPDSPAAAKSLGSFEFPEDGLPIPRPLQFEETDEVSVASSSSGGDFSPSVDASRALAAAEAQRWIQLLPHLPSGRSFTRANRLLFLGSIQLDAEQWDRAVETLGMATSLFRILDKPLALARGLDRLGLAFSRQRDFAQAFKCLTESFNIRYDELGPWHVDTVDALNHLALIHMSVGDCAQARKCYWEVFWVRRAIFGSRHASIAVTAHELGRAFYTEGALEDASHFYQIARDIYEDLEVPADNPAWCRLMRDMKRLDRVFQWRAEC